MNPNKMYNTYKSILVSVVVGLILGKILTTYVVFFSVVVGDSMNPTYYNNDRVCVLKLKEVEKQDVVVAKVNGKHIIKRCVGTPGDTIQITNGNLYINGSLFEEDYILDRVVYDSGIAENPIKLADGEYFLLGDNRLVSLDSRELGVIDKSQILGVVLRRSETE